MINTIVILAGGAGRRLWPVSTPAHPKQFFDPGIGVSLLRATIERAAALPTTAPLVIVTHANQVAATSRECNQLAPETIARIVILAEPHSRNTAAAIAYATLWANEQTTSDPAQRTTLVMPADHLITATELFVADVVAAEQAARRGAIVLFGIRPTGPATGYGYIEAGEALETAQDSAHRAYRVAAFREKPDSTTAQGYLHSGRHYWNAGLLLYRDDVMQAQLQKHVPALWQALAEWQPQRAATHRSKKELIVPKIALDEELSLRYQRLESVSIDYALLERCQHITLLPAHFDWSDIGSWDELSALWQERKLAPPQQAAQIELDSSDNFIFADMPVALCGIENTIVVAWKGTLLLCRRNRSQLVRMAAEQLGDRPDEQYYPEHHTATHSLDGVL